MSMESVIVLPWDLNDEGRDGLFSRLFIISFGSFHVVLRSFWHILVWSRNMYAYQYLLSGSICFCRLCTLAQERRRVIEENFCTNCSSC